MHVCPPSLFCPLVLLMTATLGCGSSPPLDPEIPADEAIGRLISKVDKYAHRPQEITVIPEFFAVGCAPSTIALQRFAVYRYEGKPPLRSGNTATVAVTVKDVRSHAVVGEVKWSMKKTGAIWKLTDAPLPGATGDKPH